MVSSLNEKRSQNSRLEREEDFQDSALTRGVMVVLVVGVVAGVTEDPIDGGDGGDGGRVTDSPAQ